MSLLAALAQAGMTWWMESLIHLGPLELSREIVDAGPAARVTLGWLAGTAARSPEGSGEGRFRRGT
jgi:hypothetical protein